MKLGEIADIKAGLVLSRKKAKIKYEVKKEYKVLTLKNIEVDGSFNDEEFELFESNDILDSQYFTQAEDILIRLSYPNTVVYIEEKHSGLIIPSYFAVIKITNNNFTPQYIAWYLNTDKVKKELLKSQTGTVISNTNKNILSDLDIKTLSLDQQQKIAKIQKLYWREKGLLNQLISEKEKQYKAISQKLLRRR